MGSNPTKKRKTLNPIGVTEIVLKWEAPQIEEAFL